MAAPLHIKIGFYEKNFWLKSVLRSCDIFFIFPDSDLPKQNAYGNLLNVF